MAKFVYKMENILGIKYKMEDQAKTAYGNARSKLSKEEEKLFSLKKMLVVYQEKIKKSMQPILNIFDIKKFSEAVEITKEQIKQQEFLVKRAKQQVEVARTRLNAAMIERKTHEKLKENAFNEFFLEFESEQRKEIDELVSFRYNNPTDY